jgi:hypothetical protein
LWTTPKRHAPQYQATPATPMTLLLQAVLMQLLQNNESFLYGDRLCRVLAMGFKYGVLSALIKALYKCVNRF